MNVATALESVGGSFDDVAKLTSYVVDWTGDKMAALGEPDLLVEVEAVAVLP